jgi:hypothetical protein
MSTLPSARKSPLLESKRILSAESCASGAADGEAEEEEEEKKEKEKIKNNKKI